MNETTQRGPARRVCVRSTSHYNVMRLQNQRGDAPRDRLSPAALWVLLAYLPPHVRARPWVRHLVEEQLAGVDTRPANEQQQIAQVVSFTSHKLAQPASAAF